MLQITYVSKSYFFPIKIRNRYRHPRCDQIMQMHYWILKYFVNCKSYQALLIAIIIILFFQAYNSLNHTTNWSIPLSSKNWVGRERWDSYKTKQNKFSQVVPHLIKWEHHLLDTQAPNPDVTLEFTVSPPNRSGCTSDTSLLL